MKNHRDPIFRWVHQGVEIRYSGDGVFVFETESGTHYQESLRLAKTAIDEIYGCDKVVKGVAWEQNSAPVFVEMRRKEWYSLGLIYSFSEKDEEFLKETQEKCEEFFTWLRNRRLPFIENSDIVKEVDFHNDPCPIH